MNTLEGQYLVLQTVLSLKRVFRVLGPFLEDLIASVSTRGHFRTHFLPPFTRGVTGYITMITAYGSVAVV